MFLKMWMHHVNISYHSDKELQNSLFLLYRHTQLCSTNFSSPLCLSCHLYQHSSCESVLHYCGAPEHSMIHIKNSPQLQMVVIHPLSFQHNAVILLWSLLTGFYLFLFRALEPKFWGIPAVGKQYYSKHILCCRKWIRMCEMPCTILILLFSAYSSGWVGQLSYWYNVKI